MKENLQWSQWSLSFLILVFTFKSVSVHQALLSSSAREQVVPSISPFPARCWNGSINETTLKTKVQTLTDASSPRQLFSVGGLSANQRAGPQEVAICGASRRRSPRLMCFLERRKCDGGGGWGEVGNEEDKSNGGGGGENTSPRTPAGCRNACYGCTSLPAPPPGAPKLRGKKEEMLIMCFLLFSS